MFEPQDHPNDFHYPGGPPVRPYDAAGWTLAFQMGVKFDRVLSGFDGPFERVGYGDLQSPPEQQVVSSAGGYVLAVAVNNSFIAVNDLLKAGIAVYRLNNTSEKGAEGSFYVPQKGQSILQKAGIEFGTQAKAVNAKPAGGLKLHPEGSLYTISMEVLCLQDG